MKYLRMTMWVGRNAEPTTTIIPETELREPIHTAATIQRNLALVMGDTQVETEVHEFPDTLSFREAAAKIHELVQAPMPADRRHRHALLDWAIDCLGQTKPTGLIQTTRDAPLSVETLCEVLEQVLKQPQYKGQTIRLTAHDGTPVNVVNGAIVTEPRKENSNAESPSKVE